jgi:hypothetical protein
MTKPTDYLEIARRYLREHRDENQPKVMIAASTEEQADSDLPRQRRPQAAAGSESTLKGRAVELWSTAAGRLFLVADEEDARLTMERFGVRRGEIYTSPEVRRIIEVNDPTTVGEIHEWKRRFDGVVQDSGRNKG